MRSLELWGGVECTLCRIGERYVDQTIRNAPNRRFATFRAFADLGLKALRYPVLWEKLGNPFDWSTTEGQLEELRSTGITPIVGLLHHGSGPRHTDLLDERFAEKFSDYALAFARRFPWVEFYTPINEPLTTARFSCLYGHWYPHYKNDPSFVRAVIHQCEGIRLALKRIRTVQPAARHLFTEDLGEIRGTAALSYQVVFENERRWLSGDLLTGKVTKQHPLWTYLVDNGASERDLMRFHDEPSVPDVWGINHYVTSSRFLDQRLSLYPERYHGGNQRDRYADVEAVRVVPEVEPAFERLIAQTWERYRVPPALTEVHLGCGREDQLRWLKDAWQACEQSRAGGIPVEALTSWALLGSRDWNTLVTEETGHYESGAFDVRGGSPRLTAVGKMVRALARGETFAHPVLDEPGWWSRPADAIFESVRSGQDVAPLRSKGKPLLVLGSEGTLGSAFLRISEQRALPCRGLGRGDCHWADRDAADRVLNDIGPWAVVNAAGFVNVDRAESQSQKCFADNTDLPARVAEACARAGLPFLTFSSDLVFDGAASEPYVESHLPRPLSVYGRSKLEAEKRVAKKFPGALIIRTSAFFGPWDTASFSERCLESCRARSPFLAASDVVVSPTYVPDLVHHCLDLLIDGETGLRHLANQGQVTWLEFARRTARAFGLDPARIVGREAAKLGLRAPRPRFSVLGSERGHGMPTLEDALARYRVERRPRVDKRSVA